MDAKINGQALTDANKKYFTYTVKYDGNTYTSTDNALESALAAGASKPLVIRVDYVQPADSADLPQQDLEVNVTGKLTYSIAE